MSCMRVKKKKREVCLRREKRGRKKEREKTKKKCSVLRKRERKIERLKVIKCIV